MLTNLAGEVGLAEQDCRRALQTRQYRPAHQAVLRHAHEAGVTAVPAFLISRTVLIGVQGSDTLGRAIDSELRKQ